MVSLKAALSWLLGVDILRGFKVVLRNFFAPKVTLEYPEQRAPTSVRFRGLHALRRYESGQERCIACKLCEAVCPALAITIDPEVSEDGTKRAARYDIDLFKCVYCGLCEEACPVDAIVQTNISDYHFTAKGQQIMTKEKLLAIGDNYESQIAHDREQDANFR